MSRDRAKGSKLQIHITDELNEIMKEYVDKVGERTIDVAEELSKDCVKELKVTSPKSRGTGGGYYAKGWSRVKKNKGYSWTVYNKNAPQLTHLLNNPHLIVNQYGEYGRTNGDDHIGQAERKFNQRFMSELRRRIEGIR